MLLARDLMSLGYNSTNPILDCNQKVSRCVKLAPKDPPSNLNDSLSHGKSGRSKPSIATSTCGILLKICCSVVLPSLGKGK